MNSARKDSLREWADKNISTVIMDFYLCPCQIQSRAFAMDAHFTDEEIDYMTMYLSICCKG